MSVENVLKQRLAEQEALRSKQGDSGSDLKSDLLQRIRGRIAEQRSLLLELLANDHSEVRSYLARLLDEEAALSRSTVLLGAYERSELLDSLMNTLFGYGILEPLLNDPQVTEVMVNGLSKIYIEREGQLQRAKDRKGDDLAFSTKDELMHVIEKIVAPINRKVDESDPIVDARLPNGSRVNVVLSPISLDGTCLTIRKFPERPYSFKQLVQFGTMELEVAQWLQNAVRDRKNIMISGGTGSGKTTLLNALGMSIAREERVITIEDAAELKLSQVENLVRLETRPPNLEGKGEIRIRDLLRTALRMRPDRIIVGEVRGGEALDMLQAMNTGHDGSLSTAHANRAVDLLSRLETMVLMAGLELPLLAIRQQIASAIDLVVQVSKMRDHKRRITEILAVDGVENGQYLTTPLFVFDESIGRLVKTEALLKVEQSFSYE